MKDQAKHARINGEPIEGQAHIQPAPNYWIGIFRVKNNLLEGHCSQWKSVIVEYEGPINCKEECTDGKGKAKIIHAIPAGPEDKVEIHIEATERPELEKEELRNTIQTGYNANLSPPKVLN